MAIVRPEHLQALAASEFGETKIGELLRRLIYFWVPNRVIGMSFHSGTANNLPGWDGWLQLAASSDTPPLFSLWELSTRDDDKAKIRQDIKASFDRPLPPGWEHAQTTFVAVTLRKLADRLGLERELLELPNNPWGDIRIIDAPALAQWIEKCPPVEAWCAYELNCGLGRYGVSLNTFWTQWCSATKPPISPELVLAGRSQDGVSGAFTPQRGAMLTVQTDSAHETAAYIYAHLERSADRVGAEQALANALVVSSLEAAHGYAQEAVRSEQIPITILLPPANGAANVLANQGHYVINALGHAAPSLRPITLKRALRREFAEALQKSMNVAPENAEIQARTCGASVSVWSVWNRLEANALGNFPDWCGANHTPVTLPAVIAAGWDEKFDADKNVLSTLSGRSYTAFYAAVQPHMNSDPPLLERVGSAISVLAPTVAFALTCNSLTPEFLKLLEKSVVSAFSKLKPPVAIGLDNQLSEPNKSEEEHHSDWLRMGLAETLLRISVFSDVLDRRDFAHEFGGCQAFISHIIGKISYFREDWRFLAALRNELPVLAEAAPAPFVDALEHALQGAASFASQLFKDRGMFGTVIHAGLLWALECLAWSSDYLPRVAVILARLVEVDPGGRVQNRPINSLRSIFFAWNPGTSATLRERLEVLSLIRERVPNVSWQLACILLPKQHPMVVGSPYEPLWKDFGRSQREQQTQQSVSEAFHAYIEFALSLSQGNISRQISLVEDYPLFSAVHRNTLLEQLRESATDTDFKEGEREEIWNDIKAIVAKHQRFSDAPWAMNGDDIDKLIGVGRLILPDSRRQEIQWLFNEYFPNIPGTTADIGVAETRLAELRDAAIKEFAGDKPENVDELFTNVTRPFLVAQQAALSFTDPEFLIRLLDIWFRRLSQSDETGIRALCATRDRTTESHWTRLLFSAASAREWPEFSLGLCLSDYPDSAETLDYVRRLNAAARSYYWSKRSALLRSGNSDVGRVICEQLIIHGRAVELVGQPLAAVGPEVALRAMQEAVNDLLKQVEVPYNPSFSYFLKENLAWLRQNNIPEVEIARMEFNLLPLLLDEMRDNEQLSLHKAMASEPTVFVAVLKEAYRPAHQVSHEDSDESSLSDFEKQRAIVSWRLLRNWRTPPGLAESAGELDAVALQIWLTEARRLAKEADRLEVAEARIGTALFHTPEEPTTRHWPSFALAKVLEDVASRDLEDGIAMEAHNSHGVTTRGVFDGGQIERDEAAQWKARANALPMKWQRAKTLCKRIAESWGKEARQMDEEAAKRRLKS
ncbi:XRE family transcriptional regulator [Burkholderia pseudomallei]|nr:XRE family transcriptional regulator [Burkholderia pseudomallei]CAJ9990766.1 XRE family transcriptional regulator [Burkholderia pseudomallei]